MTTQPPTAVRTAARRGFTLTELMVVTTLIGVMAAMSIPSFQRAMIQSRADIAVANLRTIWAAQRLYWLENHSYAELSPAQTVLIQSQLLDPSLPLTESNATYQAGGYYYSAVAASGTATTFTATATNVFAGPPNMITIDQDGVVRTVPANTTLTFQ
jgi:prepilin-type N-terminal cleavage/methylation domain-containing protein